MTSLRRTKNFATDPQTPMFLYTILKQLDLRSINWNEVAANLSISNGHAARMRYSRMRSQFEGLSNQPKPPKPKKENIGERKPSKGKTKNNKRLLIEEENERLAGSLPATQQGMQQESDPKRMKVEPQLYINPWNSTSMYTGYPAQAGANTYWGQQAIKTEPLPFGVPTIPPQSASTIPAVKKEPELAAAPSDHSPTSTLAIKQESDLSAQDSSMADSDLIVVKCEQGATPTDQMTSDAAHVANDASSYPVSHTISAYFDRYQDPVTQAHPSSDGMPRYLTSQAFSHGTYGTTNAYSTSQSAFSWTTPVPDQHAPLATLADNSNNMMLNPYATTYQDMLNMPLYPRSSPILQIPNPSSQQVTNRSSSNEAQQAGEQQDVGNKESSTAASAQEHQVLSGSMTNASLMAPCGSPESFTVASGPLAPEASGEQSPASIDVIEVESDIEMEVDAVLALAVKNEDVEL